MKKKKWLVICAIVLALLLVLSIVAVVFSAIDKLDTSGKVDLEEKYRELAEKNPDMTYDEGTGLLYMNNEIIVISKTEAVLEDIEELADDFGAKITDSMEDMGIYRFEFEKKMSIEDIEKEVKNLKKKYLIEDAYINPVTIVDETIEDRDAVYPNDTWKNASWNSEVPRDENWGVEAINAPEAWAYLDELEEVNVGLIDTMPNGQHEDLEIEAYRTTVNEATNYYETEKFTPASSDADDHGTHVAGTIGAKYNNGKGVSGILGDKGNMYYGVVDQPLTASVFEHIYEIRTLVEQDVRVINVSLSVGEGQALGYAASHGNENAIYVTETRAKLAEIMLKRLIEDIERRNGNDFVICVAAGNANNDKVYKNNNATYGYSLNAPSIFSKAYSGGVDAQYSHYLNYISDQKVKDRIIVVGSVKIDKKNSTKKVTKYEYSDFSNIGARVDVVAPGENIYSLAASGYKLNSGTSMATPHVSGVAGLAFAANPALTGPQVKAMVTSLTTGRYYYGDDFSGMVNAEKVVKYALDTKDGKAAPMTNGKSGLDLCFVVDTTGSMGDDIDNAKENMVNILSSLSEKTPNYRVALVDYRDFPDRTHNSEDYPAKVQLDFSSDDEAIKAAINGLTLGNGGDGPETVYSGIAKALSLKWSENSKRVIIILGDAKPLDPEPNTNYTYDDVLLALYNADVGIDTESSDSRVLGEPEASAMNVYSIGVGSDASEFFESVATETGGAYTEVGSAEEVSDAIIESIDKIQVSSEAMSSFGEDCSGELVDLYKDGEYQFSYTLSTSGEFLLAEMEIGSYEWRIQRLGKYGMLNINQGNDRAEITESEEWYTFAMIIWHRHKLVLFASIMGVIVLVIVLLVVINRLKNRPKKEKIKKTVPVSDTVATQTQTQTQNTQNSDKKFCQHCGHEMNSSDAFCQNCGTAVNK